MDGANDLTVFGHEQYSEVAVDLDSPAGATRGRPRRRCAEQRDLRLARHRPRPIQPLPALEREECLLGEVVRRPGDVGAVEVAERL
jgi:hypothetical protein